MSYTYSQPTLWDDVTARATRASKQTTGNRRAIEDPAFPFEELSEIAELESWRKEVNRPIYHLHKWWAQRLGSVFRGILIASQENDPAQVIPAFYSPTRYTGIAVFDPFMGSGTTVGEALKLGMRGIGRDINQVAFFAVRNAFQQHSTDEVIETFKALENDLAPQLRRYFSTRLADGTEAEVLYFFWVKTLSCPSCSRTVDLFPSYIFSRNAYPNKHPAAQILCPTCGEINEGRYDSQSLACRSCQAIFNPQLGPAKGQRATCQHCHTEFAIAGTVKQTGKPPIDRLYAKMVLLSNGSKRYMGITDYDHKLYQQAESDLAKRENPYPIVAIQPGNNTNQVLNYGYRYWHQMFSARQLLALSLLGERIVQIENPDLRNLFTCLFSGVLEFNNLFASFKGEGTGAVRHMFSHHILKPERTPLEANLWGTPKSSGSYSTLFRSRLLRAMEYQIQPFEIRPTLVNNRFTGKKVHGLSAPMGRRVVDNYADFVGSDAVYLSCGDSSTTDIPSQSVDLVITDPPFFDNVHYSELADFFHVWQRHLLVGTAGSMPETTRSDKEVQSHDPEIFANRLGLVLHECHRVVKPTGLVIFSYHHSKPEGWHSLLKALTDAQLVLTAAHPIKAEMSGAAPKSQASSPINIDVILVCRPVCQAAHIVTEIEANYQEALSLASDQVRRFVSRGRQLSRNDVKVIVMAQLLKVLSQQTALGLDTETEVEVEQWARTTIDELYRVATGESAQLGAIR